MRHYKKYILLIRNDKMEHLLCNCNPQNLFIKSRESWLLKYKEDEKRVMFELVYRCMINKAPQHTIHSHTLTNCPTVLKNLPLPLAPLLKWWMGLHHSCRVLAFSFHGNESSPFSLNFSHWFRFAGRALLSLSKTSLHEDLSISFTKEKEKADRLHGKKIRSQTPNFRTQDHRGRA